MEKYPEKGNSPAAYPTYRPKERGEGLTSDYHGRQLPAGVAATFGLPPGLEAGEAHLYGRQVREAEFLGVGEDTLER